MCIELFMIASPYYFFLWGLSWYSLSFLILVLWVFAQSRGLSILLMFSKNQLLFSLIFFFLLSVFSFTDFYFISFFCLLWVYFALFLVSWGESVNYSWPLNNRDLNCTGPLICGFFFFFSSITQSTWLVESTDVDSREETRLWRKHGYGGQTVRHEFSTAQRFGIPNACIIQWSTVFETLFFSPKGAFAAMNFPLSTASAVAHKLSYVVFSFSLILNIS